jgi:malate dehydrogenase (oxaloacetate-decarboxylating)(NADP+)
MFGVDPVIAMISFSNFGSSTNDAAKVREAVAYLHKTTPIWLLTEKFRLILL